MEQSQDMRCWLIRRVGNHYRQEYYFNVAEDEAEVMEQGLPVTVPYGTFQNCIKIKETTVA